MAQRCCRCDTRQHEQRKVGQLCLPRKEQNTWTHTNTPTPNTQLWGHGPTVRILLLWLRLKRWTLTTLTLALFSVVMIQPVSKLVQSPSENMDLAVSLLVTSRWLQGKWLCTEYQDPPRAESCKALNICFQGNFAELVQEKKNFPGLPSKAWASLNLQH